MLLLRQGLQAAAPVHDPIHFLHLSSLEAGILNVGFHHVDSAGRTVRSGREAMQLREGGTMEHLHTSSGNKARQSFQLDARQGANEDAQRRSEWREARRLSEAVRHDDTPSRRCLLSSASPSSLRHWCKKNSAPTTPHRNRASPWNNRSPLTNCCPCRRIYM